MTNNLEISGFKCFSLANFELKDLTVLTGSNGTGKSSLIQAILLIRLAIEKNALNTNSLSYSSKEWRRSPIPLNFGYELNLGTIDDIFNENDSKSSGEPNITLTLDEEIFEIPLPKGKDNYISAEVNLKSSHFDIDNLPFWRKREFYYLYTERLGPRHSLSSNYTDFIHCGHKGEFTGQVLLNNPFLRVDKVRQFPELKSEYLPQQVDAWLALISPGTNFKVEALGTMSSQIKLKNGSIKNHVLAPNIGFGISYVLPVLVTGLIAEKGAILIVENPEAHLHPKGQSNIGFFLGTVAASGVKVLVETHSEHVVNGIRRSILSKKISDTNNTNIYFFRGADEPKKISITEEGDLTFFPRDFFDQVNQDMAEIFRLKKKRS